MRVLWGLPLVLLIGCPKTVVVTCTWNPPTEKACGVAPCLQNYTLSRADTGAVIATIPMFDAAGKPVASYVFTASTSNLSGKVTLALQDNQLNPDGTITASPRALSSVTIQ